MENKKILIVEDEKTISDILVLNLDLAGFQTICAENGRDGLALALSENPDLILLDVMLPELDGFAVCKEFRAQNKFTPIIMLTAREEERDMVFGLELGADDYMTKPFSVRELLARVKTNIRRGGAKTQDDTGEKKGLKLGRITIDEIQGHVYKDQTMIDLTQREFALLLCLAKNPERVFSREDLMQEVWQYDYYGDVRVVDVAIRRLREKIEDNAANPNTILTKRGIGYFFQIDSSL